jgi:hypothetical protein
VDFCFYSHYLSTVLLSLVITDGPLLKLFSPSPVHFLPIVLFLEAPDRRVLAS